MAAQRSSSAKTKKAAPKKAAPVIKKKKAAAPLPKAKAVKAPAKAAVAVKPTKAAVKPAKVAAKAAPVVETKPRKTTSGLNKADLEHFRELLLEKRREIIGDVGTMESEAFKAGSNLSNMPIHMADVGTDNFEQEFTLGLMENERKMLREIQEALARIEDGTYGICQGTNKPIPRVRLEAVPWAKFTAEYARALEQGLIRRDAGRDRDGEGSDEDEE